MSEALFPQHKCGLFLTHNEHRDYYMKLADWLDEQHNLNDDDWVTLDQKARALETDSCWVLQWYPDTPVGSYKLLAADLDILLEAARAVK